MPDPESTTQPVYEPPIVMDLNKVQNGEGLVACAAGSADIVSCATGAGNLPN